MLVVDSIMVYFFLCLGRKITGATFLRRLLTFPPLKFFFCWIARPNFGEFRSFQILNFTHDKVLQDPPIQANGITAFFVQLGGAQQQQLVVLAVYSSLGYP